MATYVYCKVQKKVVLKEEALDLGDGPRGKGSPEILAGNGARASDVRITCYSLHRKKDGMDKFWGKFDEEGRAVCTSQRDVRELQARLEGRWVWD